MAVRTVNLHSQHQSEAGVGRKWINSWMQVSQQQWTQSLQLPPMAWSSVTKHIVIPEDDAGVSGTDSPVVQSPAVPLMPVRRYPERTRIPPERLGD